MSKILKSLTETSMIEILKWLLPILGGTLGAVFPILSRDRIAPLLTQTQWLVLSALLLGTLFATLLRTFQYHHQIYSEKRRIKILLKSLQKQISLSPQATTERSQERLWLYQIESFFKQPILEDFFKDLRWPLERLRDGKEPPLPEDRKAISDVMLRAIEHLKFKLDLL